MNAQDIIRKIEGAGFNLSLDGSDIVVTPPGKLTDCQREFLKSHKAEILETLRSAGSILEADQAGNDVPPANDPDRALIHCPELRLASGKRISCDMTVPRANLDKLRAVIRFRLKDNGGGGSLLGSPGTTESELKEILTEKYGARLASIDGQPAPVPTWIEPITCKDLNQRNAESHDAEGAVLNGEFAEVQS